MVEDRLNEFNHENSEYKPKIYNLKEELRSAESKLMNDNNDLHFKIIKISEDIESTRNTNLLNIKRLEAERSDLRFIVSQKDTKINEMESEN